MSKRILIVDDDPGHRRLLSVLLEDEGLEADVAENGLEALQQLAQQEYGLVLTDYSMPAMDGLELIGELSQRSPSTPVILISGSDSVRDRAARHPNVHAYLPKPFSIDAFYETVKDALKRAP